MTSRTDWVMQRVVTGRGLLGEAPTGGAGDLKAGVTQW